ncbi:MAG: hypothetical protein AAB224_06295, partial [Gemmatimonadota bacterium]
PLITRTSEPGGIRGVMPLHRERVKVVGDARERLLTGDARRVALRDRIWAAPTRHPAAVRSDIETAGADTYGVDLRSVRPQVVDGWRRAKARVEDLLLPRGLLGTVDLGTVVEPHFEGNARWMTDAPLVVDGFVVWFDAELSEGEHFSSAPGTEQSVHGCPYLSLREPLAVPARAELALRFRAIQTATDYAWTWECTVTGSDGSGVVRTARQSTLGAVAMTRERLSAMSELHRPSLGVEGRRWRDAIALIDGQLSSREIANALARTGDFGCASESEAFDWLQGTLQVLESGAATKL